MIAIALAISTVVFGVCLAISTRQLARANGQIAVLIAELQRQNSVLAGEVYARPRPAGLFVRPKPLFRLLNTGI